LLLKCGNLQPKMGESPLKLEANRVEYFEVKNIQTREDFIYFLRSLKKDYLKNLKSWENRDISAFLEAMASWAEDMDGFYINQGLPIPEKPDWKVFADMLMGGKLYE
jgi:hypothetical protein